MSKKLTKAVFTEEELAEIEKVTELFAELPSELRSKLARYFYDTEEPYKKRVDNTGKDPHEGYIYLIRDPRLPNDKNIIFVGSARIPWESVRHHVERSTLPEVRKYMKAMRIDLGDVNLIIRTQEVVDYAEGHIEELSDLNLTEEDVELVWEVVAYNPNRYEPGNTRNDKGNLYRFRNDNEYGLISIHKSPRAYYTELYRSQGHPILNKSAGRPKQDPA